MTGYACTSRNLCGMKIVSSWSCACWQSAGRAHTPLQVYSPLRKHESRSLQGPEGVCMHLAGNAGHGSLALHTLGCGGAVADLAVAVQPVRALLLAWKVVRCAAQQRPAVSTMFVMCLFVI